MFLGSSCVMYLVLMMVIVNVVGVWLMVDRNSWLLGLSRWW